MAAPLKTFIIYSSKDRDLHDGLVNYLQPLVDKKLIQLWSDKEIAPGERWDAAIKRNLHNADIFLMLVSVDFYNSAYIREEEFRTAVERLEKGLSLVIPIIVRDCDWKSFPVISELQVLPTGGHAITDMEHWGTRDKAFTSVVKRLRERVEQLHVNIETAEADRARLKAKHASEMVRIMADIKAERSVLVLGPGIFDMDGLPVQHYIRKQIENQFSDQIATYYERDSLFVPKNQSDKLEIAEAVADLFRNLRPDEELFRKIIEIPFPLVVSVNPDTFLSDLAFRLGVPHRFAAFYPNNPEEIEMPTCELPLFYNITGCIVRPSSILIDYDDTFNLLRSIICTPQLPTQMRSKLREIRSFIYLGFQFNNWYTQLLVQVLQRPGWPKNYVFNSNLPDDDIQAFLLNQFKIQFLDGERDLLNDLHEACASEGILRVTIPPGSAEQGDIIRWLQKGEVEKALETLLAVAQNTSFSDEATLLAGQYRSLLREKPSLDSRDFFPRQNRIADAILRLTKQLPSR